MNDVDNKEGGASTPPYQPKGARVGACVRSVRYYSFSVHRVSVLQCSRSIPICFKSDETVPFTRIMSMR
jgi:hypothetical protein